MRPAIETLTSELETVHAALREGRISELAGRATALETELARLGNIGLSDLETIRSKARRNAICLEAALRGLREARRRVAEIRAMEGGGGAYDAQGRRENAPAIPANLIQRL